MPESVVPGPMLFTTVDTYTQHSCGLMAYCVFVGRPMLENDAYCYILIPAMFLTFDHTYKTEPVVIYKTTTSLNHKLS